MRFRTTVDEQQFRELEDSPAPETAEGLKQLNGVARGALMETLDRFAPSALDVRRAGSWSPKDHVAHLVAWERMIVATAGDRSAHQFAGLAAESYSGRDLNEINDLLFERSKETPWDDVMHDFDAAYSETTALLETMSDATLSARWEEGSPHSVAHRIAGDTFQHYLEHRRWLNEALG